MTLNKAQMYKHYFLVMKILLVASAVLIFKSVLTDFHWGSFIFSAMGLLVIAIQFVALIKAEEFIKDKNYLGIIIGLVISVLSLGGIMLPLGLWGLYSLLNREFISNHSPNNAPSWFEETIIHSKMLKF